MVGIVAHLASEVALVIEPLFEVGTAALGIDGAIIGIEADECTVIGLVVMIEGAHGMIALGHLHLVAIEVISDYEHLALLFVVFVMDNGHAIEVVVRVAIGIEEDNLLAMRLIDGHQTRIASR